MVLLLPQLHGEALSLDVIICIELMIDAVCTARIMIKQQIIFAYVVMSYELIYKIDIVMRMKLPYF